MSRSSSLLELDFVFLVVIIGLLRLPSSCHLLRYGRANVHRLKNRGWSKGLLLVCHEPEFRLWIHPQKLNLKVQGYGFFFLFVVKSAMSSSLDTLCFGQAHIHVGAPTSFWPGTDQLVHFVTKPVQSPILLNKMDTKTSKIFFLHNSFHPVSVFIPSQPSHLSCEVLCQRH